MATPQSLVHGSVHPLSLLASLVLAGLVFLHVWELPQLAAAHGGFSFLAAWLLCYALLGLPLLLTGLMLGRRSRRSPIEGMAFLTREADTARVWRAPAWGSALVGLLALAALALLAGGSISLLARELELVDGTVQAVSSSGLVWPLGTGALFLLAAGASLLAPLWRRRLVGGGLLVVVLLLLLAALGGLPTATAIYRPGALTLADWQQALRLALCTVGVGSGIIWTAGMQMSRESSLGRLGLLAVVAHALLGLLLMLALAPFVAAAQANANNEAMQIVPSGAVVWILMTALLLAALLGLSLLAGPLLYWLEERKLARLPAVLLVFVLAAMVAEAVWFFGNAAGLQMLLRVLGVVVLLVLLGQALFAGWVMKISHARKELNLPNEGVYNVWRVLVRIVLPLAVLWVLSGMFA